jgi:hypothetical protein
MASRAGLGWKSVAAASVVFLLPYYGAKLIAFGWRFSSLSESVMGNGSAQDDPSRK